MLDSSRALTLLQKIGFFLSRPELGVLHEPLLQCREPRACSEWCKHISQDWQTGQHSEPLEVGCLGTVRPLLQKAILRSQIPASPQAPVIIFGIWVYFSTFTMLGLDVGKSLCWSRQNHWIIEPKFAARGQW